VQLREGIKSFPLSFGDWTGRSEAVDPDIIVRSGAEEAFSGIYRNSKHDDVSVYLGYRGTAFLENENFFHSPTVCLPAAGLKEKEISTNKIKNVPVFRDLTVTKMIVDYLGRKHLVYFWFQTKNKATHDKNINRFHLALHAIRSDNTYDLFIRLMTPINSPGNALQKEEDQLKAAHQRLDNFSRDMMEVLFKFIEEKQIT
jgi:EpsI family protein